MSYISDTFLKPLSSSKNIQIFDINGDFKFSLKPPSIKSLLMDVLILKIILKTGKILILILGKSFSNIMDG